MLRPRPGPSALPAVVGLLIVGLLGIAVVAPLSAASFPATPSPAGSPAAGSAALIATSKAGTGSGTTDADAEVGAVSDCASSAGVCRLAVRAALPPTPTPRPRPAPVPAPASASPGPVSCGFTDYFTNFEACVSAAITGFFESVVADALNPLLGLLSDTLLTTPTPDSIPAIATLWGQSWQIVLACYGILILIGGAVVMAHGTLQTQYSFKEIAPRVVIGFLAGALSLGVAEQAVEVANAVSYAVLGNGLNPQTVGNSLAHLVVDPLNHSFFLLLVSVFFIGMVFALLFGYVIRVALTVTLIAGAPLFLMFHALPQTEGIPYWWYRATGGCLAIQIVQSLTLVTSLNVFLAPGGFTLFGPTRNGWTDMLVALALIWVLYRIPFWVLAAIRRGGAQRSLLGRLVRTAVTVLVLRRVFP